MNTTEKFVYSSIATLVIAFTSSLGVCCFSFLSSDKQRHYFTAFFTGLAFSSLLCDSFLHLLPDILFDEHNSVAPRSNSSYVRSLSKHSRHRKANNYVFFLILVTIYIIFFLQTLFNIIFNAEHTRLNHSHDYITPVASKSIPAESEEKAKLDLKLCGMSAFGWMVTIGDAIHNICDGIAIAIAFNETVADGVLTSFAIGIHEFAHKMGDFTLLLTSGLPAAKATIINLATSFTAFIGLYGSLLIFTDTTTQSVMLSITIGIFVYIAMSEVLPIMKQNDSEQPMFIFVIYNIGIITSFAFMSFLLFLD